MRGRSAALSCSVTCVVAALVLLTGCTPHPSRQAQHSTGPASPAGLSVARIEHDINAAHLARPASLDVLDRDAGSQNGAAAARAVLTGRPSGDAIWAATYVYLGSGTDPAPMHRLLADRHLDVRAMAAAGSVTNGDAAGFPVLVDLLGHAAIMRGSEPPEALWQFAAVSLVRVTGIANLGPASDAGPAQLTAARHRWRVWWSAHRSTLHWDAGQQLWVSA